MSRELNTTIGAKFKFVMCRIHMINNEDWRWASWQQVVGKLVNYNQWENKIEVKNQP